MIIHVEKTFRALTGQICGKDFKKLLKITKHIKIRHERFLIPRQRYKHFRYLLQKVKVYLIGRFPTSPTYSVKNLRSTALCLLNISLGAYVKYCGKNIMFPAICLPAEISE